MKPVVKTWRPVKGERVVIPGEQGGDTDVDAVNAYVATYGEAVRKDGVFLFRRDGGLEVRAVDPAGKMLGWVGWWYDDKVPEVVAAERAERVRRLAEAVREDLMAREDMLAPDVDAELEERDGPRMGTLLEIVDAVLDQVDVEVAQNG